MFEVIEALAGMVTSMLEFPVVGYLGRLVPAGGSEAGQQVATAFGTGLDNLGSLCSQAGLDRWELLGLAVLSAITVYRKELSSNSVYNGKRVGKGGKGQDQSQEAAGIEHVEGCPAAVVEATAEATAGADDGNGVPERAGTKPSKCKCECDAAQKRRRRASLDERKLRRLVEGRIRSLDLPVHHLQQLRASVDASWSSFAAAWEARRARTCGAGGAREGSGADGEAGRAGIGDFVLPPCSHASSHRKRSGWSAMLGNRGKALEGADGDQAECVECAALAAARRAAEVLLRNEDGTVGLLDADDVFASSQLGALPVDALNKSMAFLSPRDLLTLAQVSAGAREVADSNVVWRGAWLARFGFLWGSGICQDAAKRWHLHGWNPHSSSVPQGWKVFFSEFEASWVGWVAAGQNSEHCCLVGLHGRIYDITDFMHSHPGSPETLMDNAGADATEFFEDVGHSSLARDLMKTLDSVGPTSSERVLASTAQRLSQERIAVKREADAIGSMSTTTSRVRVFVCKDCEKTFEPADATDADGSGGNEIDAGRACTHATGTLRLFYSPIREEWGGFYSCCRKHLSLLSSLERSG